jgi:hypothetical protein
MSDNETIHTMWDAGREADELNAVSQPLGYAVTWAAGGELDIDEPTYRRFTVHRIDKPVASGPRFDTAADVHAHLDKLGKLPRWRLDLDDDSIEFDNTELAITDKRTGESFCLKGWKSLGVTGVATGDERPGAYEGAQNLSVVADEPPTIGHWYKSDLA